MRVTGIDPGLSGGIATLDGDEVIVVPLPVLNGRPDLHRIMLGNAEFVCIERHGIRPGQSANAVQTGGINYGMLIGFLTVRAIPFEEVGPSAWKKAMNLTLAKGATTKQKKEASIALALQLFPDANLILPGSRVYHDGMAEALLIAEYARRHLCK
jgi:hypothetical protein